MRSRPFEAAASAASHAKAHPFRARVQTWLSADNAALTEMDVRKLAVGVVEFEADRGAGLRPTAVDIGHGKFEAFRLLDADPMLGPGDAVKDRGLARFGDAVDARPRGTSVDIKLKSMSEMIGSYTVSQVMEKIWKIVAPGSVSSPPRMRSRAARCSGVARLSRTSTHSPLPS
jgi:hypothetical protein